MIISHRYKFIFIKTGKTAGTSIEVFLSQCCGENDVVTPIWPHVEPHRTRNYQGLWNPFSEIINNKGQGIGRTISNLLKRNKYYNHIPASVARQRMPRKIWNSYFKFCVERNPWDKTLSHYHMVTGDSKAAEVASACAKHMCELQGPQGQWWWHFDIRTGRVVEHYPVYAVHQDSMAPMASSR